MPLFVPVPIGAAVVGASGFGLKKGYDGISNPGAQMELGPEEILLLVSRDRTDRGGACIGSTDRPTSLSSMSRGGGEE